MVCFLSLLPSIPVWASIQLIAGNCVNLDAASLMALVIVFKSSLLLFSMFTVVKESVCIVILSLVTLVSSRTRYMAVISASNTDPESLSLKIISSSMCTTAAVNRTPSLESSV